MNTDKIVGAVSALVTAYGLLQLSYLLPSWGPGRLVFIRLQSTSDIQVAVLFIGLGVSLVFGGIGLFFFKRWGKLLSAMGLISYLCFNGMLLRGLILYSDPDPTWVLYTHFTSDFFIQLLILMLVVVATRDERFLPSLADRQFRQRLKQFLSTPFSFLNKGCQSGVAITEFAIVFPIFLLIIMFIMDVGYFMSVRVWVYDSVQKAVKKAAVVPNLDVDTTKIPSGDVWAQRRDIARRIAIDEGLTFLADTKLVNTRLIPPDKRHDDITLKSITLQSSTAAPIQDEIMILLPGECVTSSEKKYPIICNRETLGLSDTDPPSPSSPASLMERHPIKAVAILAYKHFVPFLPDQVERIEAFSYRFPIPQTPFRAGLDPVAFAMPTPTPAPPTPPTPYKEPQPGPWLCDPTQVIEDDFNDTTQVFIPINAPTADGKCARRFIRKSNP